MAGLTWTRDESLSPSAKSYRTTMPGNTVVWIGTVQFDSSYPTAGEAIVIADIDADAAGKSGTVVRLASAGDNGTNFLVLTVGTQKLMAFVGSSGVEVANTVDLSGAGGLFNIELVIEFTET